VDETEDIVRGVGSQSYMRAETRSARVRVVDPVCYQVSPLLGGTSLTGYARDIWW
jgi:hypothetical protein